MILVMVITLFIFGLLFFAQIISRALFEKHLPFISKIFPFIIFIYSLVLTYFQYNAWKDAGGVSLYFLPPYKSIFYVFGYVFIRFTIYYLVSLILALLFFFGAKKFNERRDNQIFEPVELYLGALIIFLFGFSGLNYLSIYYILALGAVYLIWHVINLVFRKDSRLPLYYLWLPVAILVIIIKSLL